MRLGSREALLDGLEGGESEESDVGGGWTTRAEDGDSGDDTEGSF